MSQIKLTGRFVLQDLLVCSLVVSSSQTITQTFWRQLLKFSHAKEVWCSPNVNFCALVVYSRHKLSDIQPSDIHTSCVFQMKTVHCAEFMQIDGQTEENAYSTLYMYRAVKREKVMIIISLDTYSHYPVSPRK